MRRSGFTMSLGERSPAATSCSIGVNRIKFSRLISVTSTSSRRASVLSRYIAALSPANPPPAMTTLVFFILRPLDWFSPLCCFRGSQKQTYGFLLFSHSIGGILTQLDPAGVAELLENFQLATV